MDVGVQRTHRRWKRWVLLVLVLVLAGALSWQGFKQYLQVQRYVPLLAAALTELTGLPASINTLDVTLLPTPQLTARNVVLGEGNFRLETAAIGVHVRLRELLRHELDITSIDAQSVLVHLPPGNSDLLDRVGMVSARAKKTPPEKTQAPATAQTAAPDGRTRVAGFGLTIRQVTLDDLSIYRGESLLLRGRLELRDLLTPKITIDCSASATVFSKDTDMMAALSIQLATGEKPRLEGAVSLHRLDLKDLVKDGLMPHTQVDLDLKLSGSLPDALDGDLSGTLKTDASESFSGTIGGQLAWKDGQLLVRNFAIESPGLTAATDIAFTPGGPFSVTVSSATARGEGLRVLLALIPIPGFRLDPQENAAFSLAGLRLGPLPGGRLGLTAGDAAFEGINLAGMVQGKVLSGIRGKISIKNNVITIAELRSEGIAVSGVVHPDLEAGTIRLELAGEADLAVGQIMALVPQNPLSTTGGHLTVKRFAATIAPGQTMPPDIELDGQIQDGRFTLATTGYTDRFSQLAASFGFNGKTIEGKISASSERLGAVRFEGDYASAKGLLKGLFRLDMATVAAAFIPEGGGRDFVMPFAAKLGNSSFDLSVQLPANQDKGVHLQLDRQGTPPLHGSLDLTQEVAGMALQQLTVNAEVPLETVAAALPIPVRTEGAASLSLQMGGAEPGIRINADLGKGVVRLNEYIAKKSGDPATVSVLIDPAQSVPLQSIQVTVLGETMMVRPTAGSLRIPELKLNLASLSSLLTRGGQLSGQVLGSVDLAPLDAALQLDGAGMTLGPGVAIDSITGKVGYRDGSVHCEALRVLGADSDCTFSAVLEDGVLDASVDGAKLNLNALVAMYRAFTATSSGTPPADTPSAPVTPAKRVTGKATVQLGALFYQRARMDGVRADIAFGADRITVSNLAFQADKGSAQGAAEITYGTPSVLDATLNLSGIDLDLLDRLSFPESRGMRGAMTGPVRLRFPLADSPALYKGLNGTVDIQAENGTYGRIRLATELLTVLKSTDIVRLTMPKLKDEGLTFKTSTAKLQITDGRITVEKFTIVDNAYAIEGSGVINLPADDMDVSLGFNPLKSVTGVADMVPGVKLATGLLSSGTGLRIRATGSPFNPKVRPDAGVLPIRTKPGQESTPSGEENTPAAKGEQRKNPVRGVVKGLLKPLR